MATPITLMTPPGGDRLHKIELNAGTAPYITKSWEADVIDEDIKRTNLEGGVNVIAKVKRKTLLLKNVIVNRANRRLLEDLRDSREQLCVTPPWVDCTAPLTYIPLQKTLSDLRHEDTRADVVFARLSSRFNSVTGRKTLFGEPHYEDAPRGQGVHAADIISGIDSTPPVQHFFSPELRSYLTQDAADSGATTIVYVTPAQAVLWDNYGSTVWPAGNKAFLMISNDEETTNAHELALISAINTTTGAVTLTTTSGAAALAGTANYTIDKRTYISSVLVSDCEMEDTGLGSWPELTSPPLVEKSDTQQETGSRCLRIIGDQAADGVSQTLGLLLRNTHIVVWVRYKLLIAAAATIQIRNTTDNVSVLYEDQPVTATSWTWARYAVEITGGAAGQKALDFRVFQAGAANAEFLVDRVYIFQGISNGGLEGVYDDEQVAEVVCDIAPDWNKLNTGAGDSLDESADEHGGAKAQDINVTAADRGIVTDAAVLTDGYWYWIGAYFKVASGTAQLITGGSEISGTTTAATYTLVSGVGLMTGNRTIQAKSIAGAADFLVDDVMAVRLPGNPYDDGYYDLSEPLSTAGFAVETEYMPEVANTALTVDAYLWSLSRRTYDAAEDVILYYNFTTDSFVLDCDGTTATVAKTFSAGDSVHIGCQVTGAAGSQIVRLSVRVNATAESNNSSGAAATTPTGITRLWIGRLGSGYANMARGTVSCVLVENAAFSDANITSLLDIYSGAAAPELALLEETHGILYEIARDGVRVRGPAKGDEFRLDVLLVEIGRVGVFATRDVA